MSNSQKETKNHKKIRQDSVIYRLLCRTTLLFSAQLLVLLMLYVSGNFQKFMDSTQSMILTVCIGISIFLFFLAFLGMIGSIIMFSLTGKKRNWIFFSLYLLLFILMPILFLVIRVITFVSAGI